MPFHNHTVHLFAPKGGQGCSTVAACLALYTAERASRVVVYDAAPNRELAAVYGVADANPFKVTDRVSGYHYDNEDDARTLPAADIVDWGTRPIPHAATGRRLLVVAPCYLALRAATHLYDDETGPDAVILVTEAGRCLDTGDVEASLAARVVANVRRDPAVARAVDAGVLATRTAPAAMHELRRIAPSTTTAHAGAPSGEVR